MAAVSGDGGFWSKANMPAISKDLYSCQIRARMANRRACFALPKALASGGARARLVTAPDADISRRNMAASSGRATGRRTQGQRQHTAAARGTRDRRAAAWSGGEAVQTRLDAWLKMHVAQVLAPLAARCDHRRTCPGRRLPARRESGAQPVKPLPRRFTLDQAARSPLPAWCALRRYSVLYYLMRARNSFSGARKDVEGAVRALPPFRPPASPPFRRAVPGRLRARPRL